VWPRAEGIRVDTHIESGAMISPFYDSMIAKVIAKGATRAEALSRLLDALGDTRIAGIANNIAFQRRVLADAEFAAGGVDTGYLARLAAREPALMGG
jgi:acetyl-CoA carboxylase biotin carboxylase subunit